MDVTALLNASLVLHDPPTPRSFDQSPTPSVEIDGTTAPSTVVSTPPAKSTSLSPLSRRGSDSSSSPTSRVAPPLSTSSSRSRTPWDAGGYSLPLAVDTRSKLLTMDDAASTDRPPQTAIFSGDSSPTSRNYQQLQLQQHQPQVHSFAHHHTLSSAASPQQSPRHKFSDSHSSMSSYTTSAGSADSVSHSRISSMSTISGIQPLSGSRDNAGSISIVTTDVSLLAVDDDMDQGDSAASSKTPLPPCKLLDRADLSSVGQSHQQDQQLFSPRSAAERPSSPSDAMLIARGGGARVSPQDQTR